MPGRPLVYDFDDAIFLNNSSEANRFASALKYPQKVAAIIRRSALVLAGNQYLADYARAYNSAVTVLPTCVDTTVFVPSYRFRLRPARRRWSAGLGRRRRRRTSSRSHRRSREPARPTRLCCA